MVVPIVCLSFLRSAKLLLKESELPRLELWIEQTLAKCAEVSTIWCKTILGAIGWLDYFSAGLFWADSEENSKHSKCTSVNYCSANAMSGPVD